MPDEPTTEEEERTDDELEQELDTLVSLLEQRDAEIAALQERCIILEERTHHEHGPEADERYSPREHSHEPAEALTPEKETVPDERNLWFRHVGRRSA